MQNVQQGIVHISVCVGLQLTFSFIIDKSGGYFLNYFIKCVVFTMSEDGEKWPSLFPTAKETSSDALICSTSILKRIHMQFTVT